MGDLSLTKVSKDLAHLKIDAKRLVVGIDFGTTYSGLAYCFPGYRDAKPFAVTDWPGSSTKVFKIPTALKYDEQDHDKFQWGALLQDTDSKIAGIKLLLDPDQEIPLHVPRDYLTESLRSLPASKSPKVVAADFMRAIKSHGMSYIATKVPQAALDIFEIEYVMSVPAIWTDAAKNGTLEAAKAAGITPVTLIKEPEAAALYSIRQLDMCLEPQDVIVLCDAGGGTVDLISYEVESTNPKLELKEVVEPKGGIAGSMFLNTGFKEAVKEIIPSDKWQSFKGSKAMATAEKQFDMVIKRDFQGILEEDFYVNFTRANLKDDPSHGLISDVWEMPGAKVKKIFDPLINDILRLVRDQVQAVVSQQKVVKAIFLVGGFGNNQYLRQAVENAHRDIKVVQPEESWAAIVKYTCQLPTRTKRRGFVKDDG
ncbi:hypothetical protein PWT90_00834 [Aphanocladium album]|nr:hypothetical protein PWT90_00834 [Aphanocladium album]